MNRALYAGSFDPITRGHLDIIKQALAVFDRVHIGIGQHPVKTRTFAMDHARDLIKGAVDEFFGSMMLARIEVSCYPVRTIVDHAREINATAIVRGLRQVSDFNDEFTLHGIVERMNGDIPMVYMICRQEFLHVSSSTARELARYGKDVSWLVTKNVEQALHEVYNDG